MEDSNRTREQLLAEIRDLRGRLACLQQEGKGGDASSPDPPPAAGPTAAILAAALDAVVTIDHRGHVLDFNPAAERTFGYRRAEAVGREMAELLIPPGQREQHRQGLRRYLEIGEGPILGRRLETTARRVDGTEFAVELTVTRLPAPGPPVFAGFVRDLTGQRQAEEQLRRLLAASPAVIYSLRVEGKGLTPVWVSENVAQLLGYTAREVLDPGWWTAHLHPEDRERGQGALPALLAKGSLAREYRLRHRGGDYRWIQDDQRLLRDGAGRPVEVVGAWNDITERRALEEQLRQAQKMEAVGQLAGGVAHDFNNLLTVINGYGQIVLERLPEGDPARALVREITAAGNRAAGLTRQLLAFSRKTLVEPKVLDVRVVVGDLDKILRRVIGEDIDLVTVADAGPALVKADPSQVEQVLLNLAVNARDAMPQGGTLTIEARPIDLDEAYARAHPDARPGPHVLLSVTDTGCGIAQDVQSRIWEPFFSTKGERGTGLGLATVYGVVRQAGGHVTVASEPGHGATFRVYLPRVLDRPASGKSHPGLEGMPRGAETVLLVEDEAAVRALARHVLAGCGYRVLEAGDGAEALRVAGQHGGRIDLLMTDVVLPRLGGREVANRLARLHPEAKVLYASGYADDAVVRHGIRESEVRFLQKPYSPAALAWKVREALDP